MSSSGSTAIKPERRYNTNSGPRYHVSNLGSKSPSNGQGGSGGGSGSRSPHRQVERLKGDARKSPSESVDSLEVESSFESSVDDEELFHSPPGTQRSAMSGTAGGMHAGMHASDARTHDVRTDDDALESIELTFEPRKPPSVHSHSQSHSHRAGGGDSIGSEDPSVISGLSAVLNSSASYSLGPREPPPPQQQQQQQQPKQSSSSRARASSIGPNGTRTQDQSVRDSPNHQSHGVDMGVYMHMTDHQLRAEIRVMAAELSMVRQEAHDKVSACVCFD